MERFFSGKNAYRLGWFLLVVVSLYLIQVPITQEPGAYETFFAAVEHFKEGMSPYANYGHDLYKYSPTFFFIPLYLMAFLPLLAGAILWQTMSLAIYYYGMLQLLQQFKQTIKPTVVFSLLFIFYALSDLNINGTHGQSNTLVVGIMIIGLAFYFKRAFVLAAISLAFVTNMKLFPIALTLLLFLDLNKRFISWTVLSHIVFLAFPFVLIGTSLGTQLYSEWFNDLLIDKKLALGDAVHFYLSIRPFLEANFGIIWGESYFAFVLLNALVLAVGVVKWKFTGGLKAPLNKVQLLLIFNLSLLFMLVFNTRTEGPTLVLMAPVYVISLWWVFNHLTGHAKNRAMWFLFFIFMLVSQSTSDLFRGTVIQTYSWNHNLRTLGIVAMYLVHLYWLFKLPSEQFTDDNVYFWNKLDISAKDS